MEKKLWNHILCYAFYNNFATFTDFEKKTFSQKNPILVRFEKAYYFSHILRQTCYNLVIRNFDGENIRTLSIGKQRKNVRFQRFEWMIIIAYYKYGWKIIITPIYQKHFFLHLGCGAFNWRCFNQPLISRSHMLN